MHMKWGYGKLACIDVGDEKRSCHYWLTEQSLSAIAVAAAPGKRERERDGLVLML